ncbi:MAG: hypothetical protein IT578_12485 [Verrucomicrobiae bacterium]|nr:hypothetical protein [Verrucomicrobiae bacterium]
MDSSIRRVWIVAPHFPPSNLASVHRARLLANHLGEHGWEAHVLAARPEFYEERPDPDLLRLVDPSVRVEHVGALASRWTRPFGVGDLGLRAWLPMLCALRRAAALGTMDVLHLTLPPNYPALLGRALWRTHRVPYVVDYIDPWVPESDLGARPLSKLGLSLALARRLEPSAVARASGLAGITPGYYEGVLRRNPHLAGVPTLACQYGGSARDAELAAASGIHPRRLETGSAVAQAVYAGALLPKAHIPMRALLRALRRHNSGGGRPIRLVCLGTGRSPDDPAGFQVTPLAREEGVAEWVREFPERHPYLEVLATLAAADGIVVIGSTEPHYSPSKVFQAALAQRPVFALLHTASEAAGLLKESGAGVALTFDSEPETGTLAERATKALQGWPPPTPPRVQWKVFAPHDASEVARRFAEFYERVLVYAGTKKEKGARR